MSTGACFSVNSPQVISEHIDGEEIILNFESGTYYSLNPCGRVIWRGLQDGLDQQALQALLTQRFPQNVAQAVPDLESLIDQLQREQLIVPVRSDGASAAAASEALAAMASYESPRLEKYTDLQNLLLLDPIHDVDATGWPRHPQAGDRNH